MPNRPELIARHGWDTKFGGHALRLGLQGIELMRDGRLQLPMAEPDREAVLAVRRGEVTLDGAIELIDRHAETLRQYIDGELPSPLQEQADLDAVNQLLVDLHTEAWS